jgi:hypothetical protein
MRVLFYISQDLSWLTKKKKSHPFTFQNIRFRWSRNRNMIRSQWPFQSPIQYVKKGAFWIFLYGMSQRPYDPSQIRFDPSPPLIIGIKQYFWQSFNVYFSQSFIYIHTIFILFSIFFLILK